MTERDRDRETERETDRDKETERQTDRQRDRDKERQRDRDKEKHAHLEVLHDGEANAASAVHDEFVGDDLTVRCIRALEQPVYVGTLLTKQASSRVCVCVCMCVCVCVCVHVKKRASHEQAVVETAQPWCRLCVWFSFQCLKLIGASHSATP